MSTNENSVIVTNETEVNTAADTEVNTAIETEVNGVNENSMNEMATEVQAYHSFLGSLKGKVVTVYRGGPESKKGVLLDVKSDFIALSTQKNNNNNNNNDNQNNNKQNHQIIYYQAQHVKSISEDSKSNSTQTIPMMNNQMDYINAESFVELLNLMIDEKIKINQGGPESKKGILVEAASDYIALFTDDDGMVYFNINHVKSVSLHQNKNDNNNQMKMVYPEAVSAAKFEDVFKHMEHKWVAINRGGAEAMEGVLVENSGGHYTVVSNQEVLRIHPYHIRSISSGPKGSAKGLQNQMQNQNQNNNGYNNYQSNDNSDNSNNNVNRRSARRTRNSSYRFARN
ncbi:spore coat protein CotH [Peribacillus saganii]|uniref:Spore coat protein CotH n=1 Tax=Peribacillus saganii TaxID=2303992 RepID=A0A372LIL0_9BACI|nr:spore coat protein CotH [Peribacillus saganii]RFU66189.1 spore coat protein CotH [Peribacillus saganii]